LQFSYNDRPIILWHFLPDHIG